MKETLERRSLFYEFYLYYDLYIRHKSFIKKKSYSQHGEDLFINEYFRKKNAGFYVDIGCFHPLKYNNTHLLYKNGWSGINIDMNQTSIDLFNLKRRKDLNICCALSNVEKKVTAYIDHYFSPINTLNKNYSDFAEKNISFRTHKKTHMETKTFETLVKNANINIPKIDFLNIDVEGSDYEVLEGFNLAKYKPQLVCIEMLNISSEDRNKNKKTLDYLNTNGYNFIKELGPNGIFKLI